MGKDTSTLDEIQFRLNSIQSEIEELNTLIEELSKSNPLKSELALMSANLSSETEDMLDLLEGFADEEADEEEDSEE